MGAKSTGAVDNCQDGAYGADGRAAPGHVGALFSPGELCYITDNVGVNDIFTFDHIADYVRFNKFPLGKTLRRRRVL